MKYTKFLSESAPSELCEWIIQKGYDLSYVAPAPNISTSIASHADLQVCRLGCSDNSPVIAASHAAVSALGDSYPSDIPFNAACSGRFFIHNLKFTDPVLLQAARDAGMIMVDVRQGYSKCSTVIVDEDSIITYDAGLTLSCKSAGMNVLLVRPGHVDLEGFSTGFIGGASGRVGNTIVFNGSLSEHPDGNQIIDFICERGLDYKDFSYRLTDIGSII